LAIRLTDISTGLGSFLWWRHPDNFSQANIKGPETAPNFPQFSKRAFLQKFGRNCGKRLKNAMAVFDINASRFNVLLKDIQMFHLWPGWL